MAGVFISYSRKDQAFVLRLAAALKASGLEVMRDVDDLLPAAEWREQLHTFIASADTVIFVISPDSVSSQVCHWEIDLVEKLHKRLAPIVYRETPDDRVPEGISKLHYVHFTRESEFDKAVGTLVNALGSDIEWLREHTRLAELARRWEASNRQGGEVLRGAALVAAETWLTVQPKAAPLPTSLQREFIAQSRRSAQRRQRVWLAGSFAVAAGAAVLAIFAYLQKFEADNQRSAAERSERQAVANEKLATDNETRALAAQKLAEEQRETAQKNLAGQSSLLAQLSEEQARAGDGERSINLALSALPRDLAKPDRPLVEQALTALHFAVDQDRRYMTLPSPNSSVLFGTYSHDGTRIVTGASDKVARLWDATTGELIAQMVGHDDVIVHAAFSADDEKLVTTSGQVARVWNGKTGEPLFTLKGHTRNVQNIAFTPDGRRIVTGAWDNTTRIWDAETGETLHVLEGLQWDAVSSADTGGDPIMAAVMSATHQIFGGMGSVAISPDGKLVATGGKKDPDPAIRLWDIETGKLVRALKGPQIGLGDLVESIAFSPDGSRVVAGLGDNTARVWSTATGEQILVLRDHQNSVLSASYSPDGRRIVTASIDGTARIWDAATGRVIAALHGHRDWVNSAAFSPDGTLVFTVSSDKSARLWDANSGALIANLIGHQNRVLSGGFSPDGQYLLTTSRDGSANIWRTNLGRPATILHPIAKDEGYKDFLHERPVEISDDRRRMFVGTTNIGQIGHLVSATTGVVIESIEGQRGRFVADGRTLLTHNRERSMLRLWSADNGRLDHALPGIALSLASDRRVLVSASGSTVYVHDLIGGRTQATLQLNADSSVRDAVLTAGGARVAVTDGNLVTLWDGIKGQKVGDLDGLTGEVSELALSPSGDTVAAFSKVGGVALWRVEDGQAVPLALDPREEFTELAFSGDGKMLRALRRDGGIHAWRTSDGRSLIMLSKVEFRDATVTDAQFVRIRRPSGTPSGVIRLSEEDKQSDSFGDDKFHSEFAGGYLILISRQGELWRIGLDGTEKFDLHAATGSTPCPDTAIVCSDAVVNATLGNEGRFLFIQSGLPSGSCVFDLATGTAWPIDDVQEYQEHFDGPAPQFGGADAWLLTVEGESVKIRETRTGKVAATWEHGLKIDRTGFLQSVNTSRSVLLDPSGTRVLIVADGGGRLWDAKGKPIGDLKRRNSKVDKARFVQDGALIVSYHDDGDVALWRAADGALLGAVAHPDFPSKTQIDSEDGAARMRLVDGDAVAFNGAGTAWDLKSGRVLEQDILAANADGSVLVVPAEKGSAGDTAVKKLHVVSGKTRDFIGEIDLSGEDKSSSSGRWSYDRPKGPFLSTDGQVGATTVEADNSVRLWSLADGSLIATLSGHDMPLIVAFDTQGRQVATGGRDGRLRIWQRKDGHAIAALDVDDALARLIYDHAGTRLAALLEDGTVAVWRADDWQRITLAQSRFSSARSIAFNSNDTRLLAADERNVQVWDTRTGALILKIATEHYLDGVQFSRGGQYITAGKSDGTYAWDATTGEEIEGSGKVLDTGAKHIAIGINNDVVVRDIASGEEALIGNLPAAVKRASFAAGDKWILLVLTNGTVIVRELRRGGQTHTIKVPWASPDGLFSPDGRRLLVHGASSTALLVDTLSGTTIAELSGHVGGVRAAMFSRSGRYVLTAGDRYVWSAWDATTGESRGGVKGQGYGEDVRFAEAESSLRAVVPSYDAPSLWDVLERRQIAKLEPPAPDDDTDRQTQRLFSRDSGTLHPAISSDGRSLVLTRGESLECWDVTTSKMVGRSGRLTDVSTSTFIGNNRVALLNGRGVVQLWDATACKLIAELTHPYSSFGEVVAAPDGRSFLTLGSKSSGGRAGRQEPYLWDAATGGKIAVLSGLSEQVQRARYSPDGTLILLISGSSYVSIWNASDGRYLRAAGGHQEEVEHADFSPDGKLVATAAKDNAIHLSLVTSGKRTVELRSPNEPISSLAFSRDGTLLSAGTTRGAVIVYDVATGRTLMERRGPAQAVRQILFLANQREIVAVYADGTSEVYVLAPGTINARPSSQDLIDFASIFDTSKMIESASAQSPGAVKESDAPATALGRCDEAAADPIDDQRTARPVPDSQLVAAKAAEACRMALTEQPDAPRVQHQLARALRASGDVDAAGQMTLRAAESGYAASRLALALSLLEKRDGGVGRWLEAAADDGNAAALNLLGLRMWSAATEQSQRDVALRLLERSAETGSAFAHENLATILGFWPADSASKSRRLYHLLVAAQLHGRNGQPDRALQIVFEAQTVARSLGYDSVAAVARSVRAGFN